MRKIDSFFIPVEMEEQRLSEKSVIVVDVLRASATIAFALQNGAKDIIPVASLDVATDLVQKIGKKFVLLCGERDGKKIEGYDLGNSPFEYESEIIKDKSLVFATTNGSKAIVKSQGGFKVLIGSFINLSSVAEYAFQHQKDIAIVCSGKNNRFSLEDAVCGGMLVQKFLELSGGELEISDSADACLALFKEHKRSLLKMLEKCEHGKYLSSLGFEKDLLFCSQVDSVPIIPLFEDGRIVRIEA